MTTPDAFRDAEYIADVSGIPDHVADGDHTATPARHGLRRKAQTAAKIAYIDRLLRDLDIVIYCELSALYYMDCSLILFATRAIVQLIFFTPKAPPFDPTRNQPFIGAIFSSNLFCMLLHLLFVHPGAGEETRGYLHGGLFIDFIGQKAPVSRLRLLMFDVLVMVLHLIMLGLIVERVRTNGNGSSTNASTSSATTTQNATTGQDLDSEERGVRRNDSRVRLSGDDMEQSELGNDRPRTSIDESQERTELLAEPLEESRDSHPLDTFVSGEAVIMGMSIIDTIRDQWRYNPATAPRSSSFVPSNETTTFLRERFGIEVGPDGRVVRIER
ncbi:hypothetical protein VTN77DRAFT_8403 [Rasamsonia byssochlamydoides]|uniref:uncharacterized protein n=1 Tax=Rasamsonia byssochlamydoides TaxID=89139 RepID=UPI0037421F44